MPLRICTARSCDMSTWVIIAAAGRGARSGFSDNKVFADIGGMPVIAKTMLAFEDHTAIDGIAVTYAQGEDERIRAIAEKYNIRKLLHLVKGGNTRQESVHNALKALPGDCSVVLIHDGARPFVKGSVISECIAVAMSKGACIAATPVKDTIKETDGGVIVSTPDRNRLFAAQTPQAFIRELITEAYAKASACGISATDDASLAEHFGHKVYIVESGDENLKLTTPSDFERAQTGYVYRVGQGYDAHRLVEGRELWLGGVKIEYEKGLLGHSDADCALHALCDALLGACALGDIGGLFPDNDPKYKDISSLILLERTVEVIRESGFEPVNADVTIIAQRPKLMPYRQEMRKKIAETMGVDVSCISVKATTTEKMGFEGEGLGISSHAVACVLSKR